MTLTEDQAPSKILDDSKLSAYLINIQSLRPQTDELFLLLEELNFPEIVAITEHWLNIDEPGLLKIALLYLDLIAVIYLMEVL